MTLRNSDFRDEILADGMTAPYNTKSFELEEHNRGAVAKFLGITGDTGEINLYDYIGKTAIFPEIMRNAKRNILFEDGSVGNVYLDSYMQPYVFLVKLPDGTISFSYRKPDLSFSQTQMLPINATYEDYLALENSLVNNNELYMGDIRFGSFQPD